MHDTNVLENQPIAWTPTQDVIERSQLKRFMRQVGVETWDELYQFSIRDVERFTEEVLKFLDIKFNPPYEKLLDTSDGVEFPEWFARRNTDTRVRNERRFDANNAPGPTQPEIPRSASQEESAIADKSVRVPSHAGLNITEMCLDRWQTDEMKDQPAVIWEGEDGATETYNYSRLFSEVEKCASALRARGLGKSDAIGVHLPMMPETVVILLAINRIGAIAVPVFSGYGVEAIVSRMDAVEAKALFTSFGYLRRGKPIQSASVEAAGKASSVETLFIVNPRRRHVPHEERDEDSRRSFERFRAMSDKEKTEFLRQQEAESEKRRSEFFTELEARKVPKEKIEEIRRQMTEQPSGAGAISFGIYDVVRETIDHQFPFKVEHFQQMIESANGDSRAQATSAEDPLIILYTSGTTGKPKGIAHTHASFPIKAAQDMAFGTDVGRGTRICWYTDIGWMMGPWLIYGALINGATICLYDGAPDFPTPDRMWEFCARHKVEVLGISPTLVRALAAHEESVGSPHVSKGSSESIDNAEEQKTLPQSREYAKGEVRKRPFERHDLSTLRAFASTGEPWNPAPWWWLFEEVGNSKLPIINYSGGTEISGGILMGNPLLPIKPCSFPAPCLGMDVDILDENGQPVGPNQVGELVVKQPWIGMARGFWQERERYLETYWSRFENIWVHGDWAMRDSDGHWFILGRSDDTLKVAGKRVGPAEVESLLVAHPLVTEAAVIGVPDESKGTAMVAFCVLSVPPAVAGGSTPPEVNEEATEPAASVLHGEAHLETELKTLVAKDMGKPLAPSKIHFVSALPKTRNAKVMRRVIRAAYLGQDAGDLSALENPDSVSVVAKAGSTAIDA